MDEYIISLRKQGRWYRSVIFISFFVGLVINQILLWLVRNGALIGIPEDARNYLLYTIFYAFSESQLSQILLAKVGTDSLLPFLLAVYWGYYLCAVIFFGVIPFLGEFSYRRFKRQLYQQGIIVTQVLLDHIQTYLRNPSKLNYFKLMWKARGSRFHYYVCPILPDWYRQPEYQWFSTSDISKDAWRVVATLTEFKDALNSAIDNNSLLNKFILPLETLREFYFSVACRTDRYFLKLKNTPEYNKRSARILLEKFAKESSPLIVSTARSRNQVKKTSPILSWVIKVKDSNIVRFAGAISLVAAVVMFIGVILFKIAYDQAFITWFTVSFGSLSISVGISSFVTSERLG